MTQLKAAFPISDENLLALPVGEIARAVAFYTDVLGFSVLSHDSTTAVLERDDVTIGVILKPDHDPSTAGSYYVEVRDVDAFRRELEGNGAKPGPIRIQQHDGKSFRVFFLRECDMLAVHDGYCFCFGQPA